MIDRRHLVRFALAAVVASALCLRPSAARAQQGFQRFFPLLVELPGWKAGKPDGASVEMPGASMTTATREYRRGDARVNAQVIVGPAAQGALAAAQSGIKVETSEARMSTTTIDGLQVIRSFTFKDKSGAIIAALGPNAMFNLAFNGVDEDEALALARRFDWKAIQAALPK